MSVRFTKSEMAFESPRLQAWEARLKFLLIASLAYAFLFSLLANTGFLFAFISRYCHRTGKWNRDISAPLYRLRLTLSRLWLTFRPPSLNFGVNHVDHDLTCFHHQLFLPQGRAHNVQVIQNFNVRSKHAGLVISDLLIFAKLADDRLRPA